MKWHSALVYLEDLFLFKISVEQCFTHQQLVFTPLQHVCMTLKVEKCSFSAEAINYIGKISRSGKRVKVESAIDIYRHLQD